VRAKILLAILMSLSCTFVEAQRHGRYNTRQDQPTQDPDEVQKMREIAKKQNEERQAALKRDTEKLLKLSQELKDYVDRTNQNMLSLDVIKKAEQIEKLAHSVKEKMKGSN